MGTKNQATVDSGRDAYVDQSQHRKTVKKGGNKISIVIGAVVIVSIVAVLGIWLGGNNGGGSQSSLVGIWLPEDGGTAPHGFPDDIEFFSDGTLVVEGMNGTYTIDGNRLKMTLLWSALSFDFHVNRNLLSLEEDGKTVVYERTR